MDGTIQNSPQQNNSITTNPNTATQTSSLTNITAAQSQIQVARKHLINSPTTTQASNTPVGKKSVTEINTLVAEKTLKVQVNDFRKKILKKRNCIRISIYN